MLTEKQMEEIRQELNNCERPLFFYHDDADGLCSFLQFYKIAQKGRGIMVKSTPKVDERFYRVVDNYGPDKIFALDLAIIEQEFVDRINVRIVWLDHHDLTETKGTKYYNPKQNKKNDNTCISKLSYDIFKKNFWISAVGTIGDWQLPNDFRKKIEEELPNLFNENVKGPEDALFGTKLGKLAKIFNFILKGPTKDANQAVKVLTRIESPEEILEEKSDKGKFILKKFKKINLIYEDLLNSALECGKKDKKFVIFIYPENKISMTGEISNEVLYHFPKKVIIMAREHNGQMKCSFRSGKNVKVKELLEKAMVNIRGRFGGHDNACGGIVEKEDWDKFIENMKEAF